MDLNLNLLQTYSLVYRNQLAHFTLLGILYFKLELYLTGTFEMILLAVVLSKNIVLFV